MYQDYYVLKMKKYDGTEEVYKTIKIPEKINISGINKLGFKNNGNALYSGTVIMRTIKGNQKKILVAVATGRIRIE